MIRDRRVKEPIVAITKAKTENNSLKKALDMLPLDEIVKSVDSVVITPNWVNLNGVKSGATVGLKTLKN